MRLPALLLAVGTLVSPSVLADSCLLDMQTKAGESVRLCQQFKGEYFQQQQMGTNVGQLACQSAGAGFQQKVSINTTYSEQPCPDDNVIFKCVVSQADAMRVDVYFYDGFENTDDLTPDERCRAMGGRAL